MFVGGWAQDLASCSCCSSSKQMYKRGCLQRTQQGLTTNPNFCPRKNTRKTDISHFQRIPATNGKIKATAIPKSNQASRFLRREETHQKLSSWSLRRPPSLPPWASRPSFLLLAKGQSGRGRQGGGGGGGEGAGSPSLQEDRRSLPLLFLTQGFPPSAPSAAGLLESDLGSHRVDAVISPDGRWSMRLL